ncbi:MAG TPA: hypothetical protein DCW97_06500, partial [Acidobacteria bacterium]|nr:hypothetical protein [Acidobacteriota bacterium]
LPFPPVQNYLDEVEKNLMADLDLFKGQKPAEEREPVTEEIDPFLTYRVNLLV